MIEKLIEMMYLIVSDENFNNLSPETRKSVSELYSMMSIHNIRKEEENGKYR